MRQHVQSAEGDLSMLGAVVTNVGEFTRLLNKLEEAAPKEIRSDVTAAKTVWSKQADAAAGVYSDPIGAFATALSSGILNSASLLALDNYAAEHCDGLQVFGFAVPASAPSAAPDLSTWSCTTMTVQGRPDLLSADTDVEALRTQLRQMIRDGGGEIAQAASGLLVGIDGLAPAASISPEALARTTRHGTQVVDLTKALRNVCTETAPAPEDSSSLASRVEALTPRLQYESAVLPGVYGACDNPDVLGAADPDTLVMACASALFELDLNSGALRPIDVTVPPESPGTNRVNSTPALQGSTMVWLETIETPAIGLQEITWSAVLHAQNLNGTSQEFSVVKDRVGPAPSANSLVSMISDLGVLLMIPVDDSLSELRSYKLDGKVAWSRRLNTGGTYVSPITHSTGYLASGVLFDLSTGKPLLQNERGAIFNADGCRQRAVMSGKVRYLITEGDSGVQVRPAPAALPGVNAVAPSVFIASGTGSDVTAVDEQGKTRWSLRGSVVKNSNLIGNWLVVHNRSDAIVLVSAETGREATPTDPSISSLLSNGGEWTETLASDDSKMLIRSQLGLFRVSTSELCG